MRHCATRNPKIDGVRNIAHWRTWIHRMQSLEQPSLKTLLNHRSRTDSDIPTVWMAAPIANYVILSAMPIVVFLIVTQSLAFASQQSLALGMQLLVPLALLGTAGFLVSAGSAYLVYAVINRRNNHFAREETLFSKVLESLRSRTRPDDPNTITSLSSAERYRAWLAQSGGERSAILLSLLTLIPYLGWVSLLFAMTFLSDDWREHEVREDLMIQELNKTLITMGLQATPTRLAASGFRYRSTALFVILSILTFGLLELVWLYLALRDPLAHFEYHRHLEDALARLGSLDVPAGGMPL